ncbi:hypothetical protein AB0I35_18600 [Nocardia sp. NPDC050378]|uniref:hypothetical protein n=1 Tax=Nocardia sp. NPDC050378 TaxID=3155400 RepID=UPI0033DB2DF9
METVQRVVGRDLKQWENLFVVTSEEISGRVVGGWANGRTGFESDFHEPIGDRGSEWLFVRFQAAVQSRSGWFPGVFALVNGLSRAGRLTTAEELFRQRENAWYHSNLVDPSVVDPSVYDRQLHPGAAAWFKPWATEMISRVDGYTRILDAHGIGWARVHSGNPGRILYEDVHQIIAEPDCSG